jgi:hypothetical protein
MRNGISILVLLGVEMLLLTIWVIVEVAAPGHENGKQWSNISRNSDYGFESTVSRYHDHWQGPGNQAPQASRASQLYRMSSRAFVPRTPLFHLP